MRLPFHEFRRPHCTSATESVAYTQNCGMGSPAPSFCHLRSLATGSAISSYDAIVAFRKVSSPANFPEFSFDGEVASLLEPIAGDRKTWRPCQLSRRWRRSVGAQSTLVEMKKRHHARLRAIDVGFCVGCKGIVRCSHHFSPASLDADARRGVRGTSKRSEQKGPVLAGAQVSQSRFGVPAAKGRRPSASLDARLHPAESMDEPERLSNGDE